MKKLLLIPSIFLIFSELLSAQTPTDKIWNAVLSMDKALAQKDSATLKMVLADDFVGSIPSGRSFTKADYIRYHCKPGAGLMELIEYPLGQAVILLRDNTAVVNRRVHATFKKPDGSISDFDVQRIEVCYKVRSEWRIARGQGTEINLALRP